MVVESEVLSVKVQPELLTVVGGVVPPT